MGIFLVKLYVKAQSFRRDNGQDLIEYAFVLALIALATTVGMKAVASGINTAFTNIGNEMVTYTS